MNLDNIFLLTLTLNPLQAGVHQGQFLWLVDMSKNISKKNNESREGAGVGIGGKSVRVGSYRGGAKIKGIEKLLDFHKNTAVIDSANTAALSSLLFTVIWQLREIVDGYYPRNEFFLRSVSWPLGKLRNKAKRKVSIWDTGQFSVRSGCRAGSTSAAWVDVPQHLLHYLRLGWSTATNFPYGTRVCPAANH